MAKVTRRLIPLLMVCYFTAYLDRVERGLRCVDNEQGIGLFRRSVRSWQWDLLRRVSSCSKSPATSFWLKLELAGGSPGY